MKLSNWILVATALALLPLPGAQAQEKRGIIIDNRPIDVGLISPNYVTITYVPLGDVARALGSSLQVDQERRHYSVRPSEDRVRKLDSESHGTILEAERKPSVPGHLRPDRVSGPPLGGPGPGPGWSFVIGDKLVSKGIIIVGGKPHVPLDDLAAAMGAVIEERPSPDGENTILSLVPQPGASRFLGFSERGIIIVDTTEE